MPPTMTVGGMFCYTQKLGGPLQLVQGVVEEKAQLPIPDFLFFKLGHFSLKFPRPRQPLPNQQQSPNGSSEQ